jgi:hypothetical protein
MKKIVCMVILVMVLCGCAAISINRAWQRINYADGLTLDEAIIIAKKDLLESQYRSKYNLNEFIIIEDASLWQISFALKKGLFAKIDDFFTRMAFFPFSTFFQTAPQASYKVIVSKDTGQVIAAETPSLMIQDH